MSYGPLVEHLVQSIVSDPGAVQVRETREQGALVYFVTVAPGDVGKVIGKSGRVVSAVRYLVSSAAAKSRTKAFVKVVTD